MHGISSPRTLPDTILCGWLGLDRTGLSRTVLDSVQREADALGGLSRVNSDWLGCVLAERASAIELASARVLCCRTMESAMIDGAQGVEP
jgi:hypothetical protein